MNHGKECMCSMKARTDSKDAHAPRTKWKVDFPDPKCCVCRNGALFCLMNCSHGTLAMKRNAAAVRHWRARSKAAERMLCGAREVYRA